MQLLIKTILLCLGFLSLNAQNYTFTDVVYHVKCKDYRNAPINSTGFAFQHLNEKGVLVTLHSVCKCKKGSITITKRELKNGQIDIKTVIAGFKISHIDADHDVAFLVSEYFTSPYFYSKKVLLPTKDIISSKGAYPLVSIAATAIGCSPNEKVLGNANITLNKIHPYNFCLGGLLNISNKELKSKNCALSIFKQKVYLFDNNNKVLKNGWSGSPIFLDNKNKLFAILNGGLASYVPTAFGINLSTISLTKYSDEGIVKKYCSCLGKYFWAAETNKNVFNYKIKILKKKFSSYYKYLYPIYKKQHNDKVPPKIFLTPDCNKTNPIYISYSSSFPKKHRYFIDIRISAKKENGLTNLYAELLLNDTVFKTVLDSLKEDFVIMPINGNVDRTNCENIISIKLIPDSSENNSSSLRNWNIKNQLLLYLRTKKIYKLVYLDLVAFEKDNGDIGIIQYSDSSNFSPNKVIKTNKKTRKRKSYISYPEVLSKDIFFKKTNTPKLPTDE